MPPSNTPPNPPEYDDAETYCESDSPLFSFSSSASLSSPNNCASDSDSDDSATSDLELLDPPPPKPLLLTSSKLKTLMAKGAKKTTEVAILTAVKSKTYTSKMAKRITPTAVSMRGSNEGGGHRKSASAVLQAMDSLANANAKKQRGRRKKSARQSRSMSPDLSNSETHSQMSLGDEVANTR